MAGTMLWSFLVSILILVTIHEFGHYWVAKKCGVAIEKFSIGFGPTILTWTNAEGTEFVLAAIPLGGFVKMRGEYQIATNEEQTKHIEGSFAACSVWQRMAIVAAGPLVNLIFAAMIFAGLTYGVHKVDAPIVDAPPAGSLAAPLGLKSGDVIESVNGKAVKGWDGIQSELLYAVFDNDPVALTWRGSDGQAQQGSFATADLNIEQTSWFNAVGLMPPTSKPSLGEVFAGGAGDAAGLKKGDEIITINGQTMISRQAVVAMVEQNADKKLNFTVNRAGAMVDVAVTPKAENERGKIGAQILAETTKTEYHNGILASAQHGVNNTIKMAWLNTKALFRTVTGQMDIKNIGGPVAIAKATGEGAANGWVSFLGVLAMISVSLGALNLLPIPVLDGGHLVYYLFEAIVGRPVSDRALAIGQRIGLAMLFGFMGIAFFNDANSLFG